MNINFSICFRAIADEFAKYHQESVLTDAKACGIEEGFFYFHKPFLEKLWDDIEKCGTVDMK